MSLLKTLKKSRVAIIVLCFFMLSIANQIATIDEALFFQVELILCSTLFYILCDRKNYKLKAVSLSLAVYFIYSFLAGFFYSDASLTVIFCEVIFFAILTAFQIIKQYDISSDKINKKNVMILFYKPKNLFELFTSLFGMNSSSMTILCGNKWYMFKRKKDHLQCIKFNPRIARDRYTTIDTGIKFNHNCIKELDALIGKSARTATTLYFRFNCVLVFKKFLNKLGSTWQVRGLDFVPSIYLLRRI